jgi:glycosyltransferase involved in cell wall biosynthesis
MALDSVIAQTFQDWRILLIDDGSTDNTADLVSSYVTRLGAKLKYIRQPNGGLPAARNAAIRNSSAEFLALLDADDVWLPQRLAASLKPFADGPRVGLVYGFVTGIDPHGVVTETFASRNKHAEGNIAKYIYMRTINLPCPTMTFRRKCIEEVGVFDEGLRATEDRDLWLRIAQRYEVRLVPEVIAHYRFSPHAMTTDPDRMLKAQLQFIQKHYGTPGCGRWPRRVALGGIYRQRAQALADGQRLGAALESAARSIAYDPFHPANTKVAGSVLWQWARGRRPGRA